MGKSICIIQTGTGSSEEFMRMSAEVLPDVKAYQIIDDSLLPEILQAGAITVSAKRRLLAYYQQAELLGVDAILHTCTVAAPTVDYARHFISTPIVRLDEGVAARAVQLGSKIAVFGTLPNSLAPCMGLIEEFAMRVGKHVEVQGHVLGNPSNAEAVFNEVSRAALDADAIVLAQPSMDALVPLLSDIEKPVLSVPKLGFESLRDRL